MFNSYNPTQKVSINAVSGTLTKTCEKSFFKYAQVGSGLMREITNSEPYIYEGYKKDVVILQAMCIGDNYMMFELMWAKDFEELKNQKIQ